VSGERGASGLAVVTGASSGIGAAIAREILRRGRPVLAVARRAGRLEALAAEARAAGLPAVHALPLDLTAPGAAAAVRERARELGGARWLVNDAGAFVPGRFSEMAEEDLIRMIRLNCEAAVLLARVLAPDLAAAPGGAIVNVASLAAMQPGPWFAVYGATKAFLVSFTEALAEELRGRLAVTAVCPGPVPTEVFGDRGEARRRMPWDLAAEAVARAAVDAAERRRVIAVPGMVNRATALFVKLAPRALVRRISRRTAIRYIGLEPPE
jgi:short-subunit dehydrogenase